jgi:oxygen-independent coproporphyrinogen-3 oxidase
MCYAVSSGAARDLITVLPYVGQCVFGPNHAQENLAMLTSLETRQSPNMRVDSAERAELRRRMTRPQRHRLLHGYPLAAAMPRIVEGRRRESFLPEFNPERGLLVGVLPHSFCNPAVAGCGFCTFPHEVFSRRKAAEVIDHVVREVEQTLRAQPSLAGRSISGLYFGGGTANLSPPEPFRTLCRALRGAFDVSGAEVTLEGVPAAFINRRPSLVDILREELPARHCRLSMGIQTFDRGRLRQMGRLGFGDAGTFREVVRLGHDRGFTVSGDLLFNLPAQSPGQMEDDVRSAFEIGLDHIGLYHLVLFDGLGTAWSRDPALVGSLPNNKEAAANWLELWALLHELGFYQTTLTNFERRELRGDDRRFVYEELSFRPDRFDMLGFGPTGISFAGSDFGAVKVMNPDASSEYVSAVAQGGPAWNRAFVYDPTDFRGFHLIRRLAALRIDRLDYRSFFGSDPLADFPREFEALQEEDLVDVRDEAIKPTPVGMFYADSIAGLLTRRRQVRRESDQELWNSLRAAEHDRVNDNAHGHM